MPSLAEKTGSGDGSTPGEVGNNPFMTLANAFKPSIERHGKLTRDVANNLEADSGKLKELLTIALEGKPEWAELLIFIEKFEEFFSLKPMPVFLQRSLMHSDRTRFSRKAQDHSLRSL